MTFPYDAPTLAAQTRLSSFYNGNDYDAGSNPGGMGAGGHRSNFIPSLQDVALLGDSIADAADAAETSADDAADAAATALGLATALTGTSVTSNSISTGSKAFTTQASKSFDVGSYVLARSDANPTTHYMTGQVTAYSGTSLTVNVVSSSGSGTRTDWTILGRVGLPGATGATGAQGIQGETPAIKYTFGSSTADADPGSGIFLINNATYASTTSLYFDNLDANGASQTTFLDAMDDSTNTALRGTIYMQQVDASSVYAVFNVTGAVTDGTGYRKVPVAHVMSNGTFTAGHQVAITFVRTGDKGADGAGAGDVISDIGSATDQRIVVFNGTSGKHVTQSGFVFGTSGTAIGALSTTNTWAGNQTFSGSLIGNADFSLSGVITPAQITSNTDNYAPTGNATASVFRISTDAARNLTGITGGTSGRIIVLANVGSFEITLMNDVTSTAANRFLFGADYVLPAGRTITLIYDATSARWKSIGFLGLAAAGSITRPSYSFSTDPNTGMYNVSADILGFAVGGVQAANLSSSGLIVTAATISTGLLLQGNTTPTLKFDPSSGDTVNASLFQSGDNLSISDGTTTRWTLGLTTGLMTLAGGQIKFPGTANPSADVNTLDDYEEGTFTPTLSFGGGTTGITYINQFGRYTKIGRMVYISVYISLSSKGISTGNASIGGLPFTADATVYHALACYFQDLFFSATGDFFQCASVDAGGTTITLYENQNASTPQGVQPMNNGYFLNTSQFMLTGHYFI